MKAAVVLGLFALAACGGGNTPATTGPGPDTDAGADGAPTPPDGVQAVVVTPATALVAPGASVTFAASVTGSGDRRVTWTVTPANGGTIGADGVYTAPAAAPSSGKTVRVEAASVADPSKRGGATVTLADAATTPRTTHPRLWITDLDLPRLRGWAAASNPVYAAGLARLATEMKAEMDANGQGYKDFPHVHAELYAFLSLMSSDQPTRDAYGARARTALMAVMNEAVKGPLAGAPFRQPDYATSDDSRWTGEAFALATDWAYPYLSASDKSTIRAVFLRWCEENLSGYMHPEPIGVTRDPALLAQARIAGNNYYAAHMRNLTLMSLALDAADDAGGSLHAYLGKATGAFLYVADGLMRTDARGGLYPEGFEYAPQTLGYTAQTYLALRTAGEENVAAYGPHVLLSGNPFWNDVIPAYLHSMSPAPKIYEAWQGPVYQPAWYGSAQDYWAPDMIQVLGALAAYDQQVGNPARLEAVRWIETNMAPGGAAGLADRVHGQPRDAILYFMAFDPAAAAPADPRPAQGLSWLAPGLGRLTARTTARADASLFEFNIGSSTIDHQPADGLSVELYRKGEWLTRRRVGYDLDYLMSSGHNTMCIENDHPAYDNDYRGLIWKRGSQYLLAPAGDGKLLAHSVGAGFVYATGDGTALYNSDHNSALDVLHASRSVVWLEPDHVVVYDRAETKTAGRFKEVRFHFPALAAVSGALATVAIPGGQQLFMTGVLPAGATLASVASGDEPSGVPAHAETMSFHVAVRAPGDPTRARFLHVLQGADAGASADLVTLVRDDAGTFEGVLVKGTVVLFPASLAAPVTRIAYKAQASRHLVTGLTPGAGYVVARDASGAVTITPGGAQAADSGGVLAF